MAKAIMIQGAGSNVGKSLLVAGLARAASNRGLKVAPFKPQNMSNNAAVTPDGGEIGRAQALQALAARREPTTDMNPILLKPETDTGAQVIVQGRRVATLKARDYGKQKEQFLPAALESFRRLAAEADLILVEGAGSPAETNLRTGDIANMGFAEAADIPVILAGDIERGGVIAQLVGTHAVLAAADRQRIAGFIINKFRGDVSLFTDGMTDIERHTGWVPIGVLPWFSDAWRFPAEDVMDISDRPGGDFQIVVPRLNRIANFDDLDPLSAEPGITVRIIESGQALPGDADLVLIPGSKSTIADLAHFRQQGWDIDLLAHYRRGGRILGICGGYQMLGKTISDPSGIEGAPSIVEGLGLLDVETVMSPEKTVTRTTATYLASGDTVEGYEIHLGRTQGPDCTRAWLEVEGRPEGATSPDGRVMGCYLHGLFTKDAFRAAFLAQIGGTSTISDYSTNLDQTLDQLAAHIERNLDVDRLLSLAAPVA